jgi:acyl-CoA thioester hydrolase
MKDTILFRHSFPIFVRFTDVDMMKHVTNSTHLIYCDDARMDYFLHVFGERIEPKEESLVIASITIDYIKPIHPNEPIEVKTKTSIIGNKSIQTLQHIINVESGELKSVIKVVIAGYNYVRQSSIAIPERWKKKIAEFDTDVKFKY